MLNLKVLNFTTIKKEKQVSEDGGNGKKQKEEAKQQTASTM